MTDGTAPTRERIVERVAPLVAAVRPDVPLGVVTRTVRLVLEHATAPVASAAPRLDGVKAALLSGVVEERRLSRLVLDPSALARKVTEGVLTVAGVSQQPWLLPVALMYLVATAVHDSTRTLGEIEALVFWAVLLNQADARSVALGDVPDLVRIEAEARGVRSPRLDEIDAALEHLEAAGALQTVARDPERVAVPASVVIEVR